MLNNRELVASTWNHMNSDPISFVRYFLCLLHWSSPDSHNKYAGFHPSHAYTASKLCRLTSLLEHNHLEPSSLCCSPWPHPYPLLVEGQNAIPPVPSPAQSERKAWLNSNLVITRERSAARAIPPTSHWDRTGHTALSLQTHFCSQ